MLLRFFRRNTVYFYANKWTTNLVEKWSPFSFKVFFWKNTLFSNFSHVKKLRHRATSTYTDCLTRWLLTCRFWHVHIPAVWNMSKLKWWKSHHAENLNTKDEEATNSLDSWLKIFREAASVQKFSIPKGKLESFFKNIDCQIGKKILIAWLR